MEQEFFTGRCPKCGEELNIPAKLEAFSCMYCGARLTRENLAPRPQTDTEQAGAAYAAALEKLAGCIKNYPGYQKKILRNEFDAAFQIYTEGCEPVIRLLDQGVHGTAAQRTALLQAAADRLIEELASTWKNKGMQEDDKVIIAIFLVPLVRKLKLDCSEEFCTILQKTWADRYPKSPFYLGSYEDITGGFRKKLCFITTAVCEAAGKPDDCPELTAFRAFRDGWLMEQPDGRALVEEYYDVAPGIVARIDLCTDREQVYGRLRKEYLEPCYAMLLQNDLQGCKKRYTEMVRTLERTDLC